MPDRTSTMNLPTWMRPPRRRRRAGAVIRWRRAAALVLVVLVASLGLSFPGSSARAAGNATVSVLHAVPGATVDVYANGTLLLSDFKPGTLTTPKSLPAGSYDLKVVKTGAGAKGAAVAEATANVPADANITVVAHLSAGGKPELTPYVNNVSTIPAGKARLIVRHDAAAPAVDVRADKSVVFSGLTNPNAKSGVVSAGTVSADVVLAGTKTVVIGPAQLSLKEGATTIVYAWGSASQKNLKLAVQQINGMGSAPGGVPGGTGGQADATSPLAISLIGLGVVGLAGAVVVVSRSRRRASSLR